MTNEYWLNRWRKNETGWHQTEEEPALINWFSGRPKARVFVPLCGKSLDLRWLMNQGHEVVGCELSQEACEAFLKENDLDFTVSHFPKFNVYEGQSFRILNGDIFDLDSRAIGEIDAIYDRAALIALDPITRKRYSAHLMNQILPSPPGPSLEWLQIILTRSPSDPSGPPYSVAYDEVQALYGGVFHIALLSCERIEMIGPTGTFTEESVLLLKPNR